MQWSETDLTWPFAEVIDGSSRFIGTEPETRTLRQIAESYTEAADNPQETRTISVRIVTEFGAGPASEFTMPVEPPPPLEHLEWNSGNPMFEGVGIIDILEENEGHFWALNPEGWSMARALTDFGESDACTNKEPHEVQAREYYGVGGAFGTYTVPVEEEP